MSRFPGAHVAPYTNWDTAATNIQAAINVASSGDTVLVTNGVYTSDGMFACDTMNRVAINKAIAVRSVNGPNLTRIEGCSTSPAAPIRCAYLTNGAILAGFTLTHGATSSNFYLMRRMVSHLATTLRIS